MACCEFDPQLVRTKDCKNSVHCLPLALLPQGMMGQKDVTTNGTLAFATPLPVQINSCHGHLEKTSILSSPVILSKRFHRVPSQPPCVTTHSCIVHVAASDRQCAAVAARFNSLATGFMNSGGIIVPFGHGQLTSSVSTWGQTIDVL